MKKKNGLSAILATVIVSGMLAGCSTSSAPKTQETNKPAGQKKYTINIYTSRIQPNPDSEAMKTISQKLGQDLKVTAVPDAPDYEQKLNLYYASNDLPDVFSPYTEDIKKNGTAKFTEDDLKKYMPLTYEAAIKQYKEQGYDKQTVFDRFSVDGKLATISMGNKELTYPYGLVIRQDLLDEFGLQMPKTLNDWEVFLKAYKQKYPNKYPITARGKDLIYQSFYSFIAAFGTSYDSWQKKDNKLVFGPYMPEMRDALELLSRWYKAGYINPEWITMDKAALDNEWINGNTVSYQYAKLDNVINAPYTEGSLGSIFDSLAAKNPKLKIQWAPFPKWKDNVKPALSAYELVGIKGVSFSKALEKDPDKLHAVMGVVDKLFNDKEIYMLRSYGIEGKTYDIVNGIPVIKKEFNNSDGKVKEGFEWFTAAGSPGVNWDLVKTIKSKNYTDNLKKYAEDPSGIYSRENTDWAISWVSGPLISQSGENLDVKRKAKYDEWGGMFAQVIIGSKTLNDFDKFIGQWKQEWGNDATEAANRLYLK
ncbi:hypothetical protein [Paenibacillus sp. Soil787]|uniref:hypothetical protein n=1 Tax=Paenibacillus sp. Soil787 TaxID=1736411 RepID=UPI0007039BB7|nr:hypothetical protein [Paenibacillus sp. Soil787]KRF18434.1 hypothetical protein ASG93_10260 [Paenibacillus sp. Soil787]